MRSATAPARSRSTASNTAAGAAPSSGRHAACPGDVGAPDQRRGAHLGQRGEVPAPPERVPNIGHRAFHLRLVLGLERPRRVDQRAVVRGQLRIRAVDLRVVEVGLVDPGLQVVRHQPRGHPPRTRTPPRAPRSTPPGPCSTWGARTCAAARPARSPPPGPGTPIPTPAGPVPASGRQIEVWGDDAAALGRRPPRPRAPPHGRAFTAVPDRRPTRGRTGRRTLANWADEVGSSFASGAAPGEVAGGGRVRSGRVSDTELPHSVPASGRACDSRGTARQSRVVTAHRVGL